MSSRQEKRPVQILILLWLSINRSSDVLVIDLGHLKITSDPEQERIVSTKVGSVTEVVTLYCSVLFVKEGYK